MKRQNIRSWTKKDFKIEWFSGTGAGGQHRNKHQNCVRIRHEESGIVTTGQSHRSRQANFREAFSEMGRCLKDHYYPDTQKERAPRTDVIRTYNQAENRVTDHKTGEKVAFNNFDLDGFIGR